MLTWILEILKAVFESFIWELLLALGVGAVIAALKATKEKWAGPLIYGLVTFVCIFILGFSLTGRFPLAAKPLEITPDNVENVLKSWVDTSAMSIREMPQGSNSDSSFGFELTSPNDSHVLILHPKANPDLIQFGVIENIPPQEQDALKKLSAQEVDRIKGQISIELARNNNSFYVDLPRSIRIYRFYSVQGLTKDIMDQNIQEVTSALVISTNTLAMELKIK